MVIIKMTSFKHDKPLDAVTGSNDAPVSGNQRNISAEPKVCVVIPVYGEDPGPLIASIKNQRGVHSDIFVAVGSLKRFMMLQEKQDAIYQFVEPNLNLTVGVRIASAINQILERVDLAKYDYLLRVDADVVLPPSFIKACIKQNADLVGEFSVMLLRMMAFRQVFHGRFLEVNGEDMYISLKMKSTNGLVVPWGIPPVFRRLPGAGKPPSYFSAKGLVMWKMGYEPVHVVWDAFIHFMLRHEPAVLFQCTGYFRALVNRKTRYEFARYVTSHQLPHILKNIRIRTKFHKLHLE